MEAEKSLAQRPEPSILSCSSNINIYEDVFSLRWRRHSALSRKWSAEKGKIEHGSGALQVYMPYIIVHGKSVVAEFSSLLKNEIQCEIVSSIRGTPDSGH